MVTNFKQLCERHHTLFITSSDLDLPESDDVYVYRVKGNAAHRYNFALLKSLRKMMHEPGITQIVVCGAPGLKKESAVDLHQYIDFNFNMTTFLRGKQVDFITDDQYRMLSMEHHIIDQCYALFEADDIQMRVQQRSLRLIGASIQPDGYWKTLFFNGFEINQHRLLN